MHFGVEQKRLETVVTMQSGTASEVYPWENASYTGLRLSSQIS